MSKQLRITGMTHSGCGGRVDVFIKTVLGFTGRMYICAKCGKTVPRTELQFNPIAPHMSIHSSTR